MYYKFDTFKAILKIYNKFTIGMELNTDLFLVYIKKILLTSKLYNKYFL